MENKKTSKADLENKKGIFFEIGLLAALAVVFLAFEWKSGYMETSDFVTVSSELPDEEVIPIVPIMQRPRQLPPPPAPLSLELCPIETADDISDADVELSDPESTTTIDGPVDPNSLLSLDEEDTDEVLPFVPLEDMPQFNGDLQAWLSKNLNYPDIPMEMGIQGKVYVQFVVEKDGSISNIKVTRGIDEYLDNEAIRVVSIMPKWKPGKQRLKPVRVAYNLPITFLLK